MDIVKQLLGFLKNNQQPTQSGELVMPIPPNSPTPQPTVSQLPATGQSEVLSPEQIEAGLRKFNPNTPLASQSGALSEAMKIIKQKSRMVDPFIVLSLALRESRGGLDLVDNPYRSLGGSMEGINNPYNQRDVTKPEGKYVNYPDYKTAILGGYNPYYNMQSQGIVNTILNSPYYEKYRQTGNLDDFNSVYTPQSDNNPRAADLSASMNNLKKYFY